MHFARLIPLLLILSLLTASAPAPVALAQDAPVAPAATDDTPATIVTDTVTDWVIDEGMLYWANRCPGGEFVGPGYLKRMPSGGGTSQLLATTTADECATFHAMTVEPEGLYYYSFEVGAILFRPTASPYDPPTTVYATTTGPAEGTSLVTIGDYLYWVSEQVGPSSTLHRVKKDGSNYRVFWIAASSTRSLHAHAGFVIWNNGGGLYSMVPCDAGPCTITSHSAIQGRSISHYSTGPFAFDLLWTDSAATPDRILRASCATMIIIGGDPVISCGSAATFYMAPDASWTVGQALRAGNNIFWPERQAGMGPTDGRVRRRHISGGTISDIVVNARQMGVRLAVNSLYVFFATEGNDPGGLAGGIYRLPLDASAIVRDLRADWFEVTQGIQNRGNNVPLTAGKTTVVRGYGLQASGPHTPMVDAVLHGRRGGAALPGSPLTSRNGTRALAPGVGLDRADLEDSWLFELPASWISAGTVEFRLEVDAQHAYPDPSPANNSVTQSLAFTAKGPVCNVFIPVRTSAPTPHTSDPNFGAAVSLATRLWPTRDFWSYRQDSDVAELQGCWWGPFPYPCYGPYELPDDSWKVLLSLNTRDAFTDDPDECDDAGGYTHYVGMVHPATNTGNTLGSGYVGASALWAKLPPHTPTTSTAFGFPDAGVTLAHELGHNASRNHVNCGSPDGPFDAYPYPLNQLSNVDPAGYYGFDMRTQTVIGPTDAKDLMSYCDPTWTSDYTWRALYNWLDPGAAAAQVNASSMQNILAASALAAYAQGSIAAAGGSGTLAYAYGYPTAAMSAGMISKWSQIALQAASADATYALRIKNSAGAVLATAAVAPLNAADMPAGSDRAFVTVFPAPGGVARVELLENGAVIATRIMGPSTPVVTVNKPTAGEVVDASLKIDWQATDADAADQLLYTIQYSPDNGASWLSLAADLAGVPGPSQSFTIPSPVIPATSGPNQGRIRVLASDGFNTGMGQSAGFTVPNRKPDVWIESPTPGESFMAGALVTVRGGAMDLEDGPLTDASLTWSLFGIPVGTGEAVPADGMAPGPYPVALEAKDSAGKTNTVTATLTIDPLGIPATTIPALDGYCTDAAYAGATELPLRNYAPGDRATVRMVRTNEYLWACFNGMKPGAASPGALAALVVDTDFSRGAAAQAADYAFVAGENGSFYTMNGSGTGLWNLPPGPGGLQAQVAKLGARWSAELRIDKTVLGGWDKPIGLSVAHLFVTGPSDAYAWPHISFITVPDTWGLTALGDLPHIDSLAPNEVMSGGAGFTLAIHGTGFAASNIVYADLVALPTTFVNPTLLTVPVSAAEVALPGIAQVRVRAAPTNLLFSNALPFVVHATPPTLSALAPAQVAAGAPAFTLSVAGAGFRNGDTVMWNDLQLATTFVAANALRATVPAGHVALGGAAGVTVHAGPADGGAMSNTLAFNIVAEPAPAPTPSPTPAVPPVYMPVIKK